MNEEEFIHQIVIHDASTFNLGVGKGKEVPGGAAAGRGHAKLNAFSAGYIYIHTSLSEKLQERCREKESSLLGRCLR
jgi:hypothetical protein